MHYLNCIIQGLCYIYYWFHTYSFFYTLILDLWWVFIYWAVYQNSQDNLKKKTLRGIFISKSCSTWKKAFLQFTRITRVLEKILIRSVIQNYKKASFLFRFSASPTLRVKYKKIPNQCYRKQQSHLLSNFLLPASMVIFS